MIPASNRRRTISSSLPQRLWGYEGRVTSTSSFRGGPYTFKGKIKSVRGGAFSINVGVTPLLAPIKGGAAAR